MLKTLRYTDTECSGTFFEFFPCSDIQSYCKTVAIMSEPHVSGLRKKITYGFKTIRIVINPVKKFKNGDWDIGPALHLRFS